MVVSTQYLLRQKSGQVVLSPTCWTSFRRAFDIVYGNYAAPPSKRDSAEPNGSNASFLSNPFSDKSSSTTTGLKRKRNEVDDELKLFRTVRIHPRRSQLLSIVPNKTIEGKVKAYKLTGNDWQDMGIGFCSFVLDGVWPLADFSASCYTLYIFNGSILTRIDIGTVDSEADIGGYTREDHFSDLCRSGNRCSATVR